MIPMPKLTHDGNSGHKHSELENTATKLFLNELNASTYQELPIWVDHCLAGATGQIAGSRVHPARLWGLLRVLDGINSFTVGKVINRKRIAMGDEPYSDRYCRMLASACRCASQAIQHHKLYVPAEAPAELPAIKQLPYTTSEFYQLKHLSMNASFSEFSAYEAQLKAKYSQ